MVQSPENDIYIRALEPADYVITHSWRLDEVMWQNLPTLKRYVSLDTEKRWVEKSIIEHEQGIRLRFVICLKGSKEIVSLMSVPEIDLINRKCSVSTMLAPKFRNKGYSYKCRLLVYHHLYSTYGLERIEGQAVATHIVSIRSAVKFGFVEEGRLRKAIFKDGEFKDLVVLSILRDEFYSLHSSALNEFKFI